MLCVCVAQALFLQRMGGGRSVAPQMEINIIYIPYSVWVFGQGRCCFSLILVVGLCIGSMFECLNLRGVWRLKSRKTC